MAKTTPFTVDDISNVSFTIKLQDGMEDRLRQVTKSLAVADFKTSTSESTLTFLDFMDNALPLLNLVGKGYSIIVTRKEIILGFLDIPNIVGVAPPMLNQEIKNEELFSKQNLDVIDSDFNFVLGLILGKLNLTLDNVKIVFNMGFSKYGKFVKDFSHLLSVESKILFGNVSDLHLSGFRVNVNEQMINIPMKSTYRLSQRDEDDLKGKPNVDGGIISEFTYKLPLNTFKFIDTSIVRLNSLVDSLAGGIIV